MIISFASLVRMRIASLLLRLVLIRIRSDAGLRPLNLFHLVRRIRRHSSLLLSHCVCGWSLRRVVLTIRCAVLAVELAHLVVRVIALTALACLRNAR